MLRVCCCRGFQRHFLIFPEQRLNLKLSFFGPFLFLFVKFVTCDKSTVKFYQLSQFGCSPGGKIKQLCFFVIRVVLFKCHLFLMIKKQFSLFGQFRLQKHNKTTASTMLLNTSYCLLSCCEGLPVLGFCISQNKVFFCSIENPHFPQLNTSLTNKNKDLYIFIQCYYDDTTVFLLVFKLWSHSEIVLGINHVR